MALAGHPEVVALARPWRTSRRKYEGRAALGLGLRRRGTVAGTDEGGDDVHQRIASTSVPLESAMASAGGDERQVVADNFSPTSVRRM
jgi:hypothetical protein